MSISSIQGQPLEVTVIGCNKLKDTEWISRQDPYVCLEYGSTKFRTRTHTDGGKDPVFQEKYVFTLIEGLRELKVVVWNSNTITSDVFIGTGKVQLQKVLSEGFDDTTWTINTKTDRYAGEVRLMLKYSKPTQPAATSFAPSAPPYAPQVPPQYPMWPPSIPSYYGHPPTSYPSTQYPTPSTASYAHPPPSYSPPPSYHPAYPPSYSTPYPPPPEVYPPAPYPQQHPSYYPPGSYQGAYPRPGY